MTIDHEKTSGTPERDVGRREGGTHYVPHADSAYDYGGASRPRHAACPCLAAEIEIEIASKSMWRLRSKSSSTEIEIGSIWMRSTTSWRARLGTSLRARLGSSSTSSSARAAEQTQRVKSQMQVQAGAARTGSRSLRGGRRALLGVLVLVRGYCACASVSREERGVSEDHKVPSIENAHRNREGEERRCLHRTSPVTASARGGGGLVSLIDPI